LTWWNEAALTLCPGGEALAIGHRSGNVSLYNLEYGVQRGDALATEGPVSAMAVSPDGTTLVTGATDGRVQFWDSEGRPKFLAFPTLGSVRSLRYTSDGRGIGILLADGSIRIWRMPTRSLPTSRPLPVDLEGRRAIRDASFLPGSDHVLILAPQIQHARMLNSEGLPVADPLPFLWPNRRLIAADPTGQRWVTSSHGAGTLITEIRLYDANGKPIGNPLPHENWIAALAISPDGKTLAATGFAGRVWLYDAATGQPLKILRTGRINMSLAFSPDSKTLAVGTGPSTPTGETVQIQRWNVESGQLIKAVNMPDWTTSLTFSPDGRSLLARLDHEMTWSYFGKYQLLDVDSLQLRGEPLEGPTSVPGAVAFLPGNRLLTRGPDGLWEWDVIAGKASRLVIPLKDPVHSLKVSSGGRWLAILNDRGEGQTFDAATYRAIGPPLRAPKPLAGLAFAGDNRSIIGAVEDFSLRIWPLPDPESGTMTPGRPVDLELATGTELDPSTGAIPPLPILALTQRFQAAGPAREWMSDGDEARWHAESASSAEAAGNQFAALWHLDRLASFQPGNWSIQARRAGIFADRGQLDRASAELDQAAKTTPSVEALGNWIFGAAITARDTGRLVLARWYLDRLLRDSPQHILALVERSEIHDRLGQVDQSDADLDRAIALGIDLSSVERTIDRLARAQRWDRAAALLKIVDHREPAFSEVLSSRRAIASLMANDLAGYRDACARMLARMPRSTGWMNAEESVYQCALAPQALTDFSLPIARVQQSLDATPSDRHSRRHYLLLFLGALQFRAGDPARARMTLLEAQKEAEGEEEPQDWAFLALTARALGKAEVSEYLKHLEAIRPSADPWDSAELWLLRKEARD
jgi:WD40 repeat protein/Flp pilus assembly protein TadD